MNAPQKDFADIAALLPRSPGIIGQEDFRCTAVLVPLLRVDGEIHVLFEVRAAGIRQPGEVCFPGGHYEKGRDGSFRETALRETCEELGMSGDDALRVHCLGELDTLVSVRGLLVKCFLGWLDIASAESLCLETDEVASVFTYPLRWFHEHPPEVYHKKVESSFLEPGEHACFSSPPIDELGLPQPYKGKRDLWYPRTFVYRTSPIIWGVTAAILENAVRRIFAS